MPTTTDLLLASGAQDTFIRLWKVSTHSAADENTQDQSFRARALRQIRTTFAVNENTYEVKLEALLTGHDNWVYSVRWHPRVNNTQPMILLSASMDRTMIMWHPDPATGIFVDAVRVGEVGNATQ